MAYLMMTTRMMVKPISSSSPPSTQSVSSPTSTRPVRAIPGSYGWPLLGPISDRLDYFWFQGPDAFFKTRVQKYKSTVFRTNVPPTFPFFSGVNPNVVAVLDCESFSHLFDMEIVEKKNILVGDFMPSVKFTGNLRTCAYLDTSEPQHAMLRDGGRVSFFSGPPFFHHLGPICLPLLLTYRSIHSHLSSKVWISSLLAYLDTMCNDLETSISEKSSASYLFPLQQCLFSFLMKSIVGADPSSSPKIAKSGYTMLNRWLAFQLLPTIHIGVAQPLEEIFLHSFAYPAFLVSGDYNQLYEFIKSEGTEVLERGKTEFGLTEEETIHNLLFVLGFNAYGGFSVFLPGLINRILSDTTRLQERLCKEARENGGPTLTFDSVKEMPLVQSVVYEALRLSPPVPIQYGRARKDFQLSTHDAVFDVKKGELLCGYQPLVMRDPKIFAEPEIFKPDRFTGAGVELLNYLYWSNGPQTVSPTESNKQCAAKDHVTLTAAVIVAYLFRRYDFITGDSSTITGVVKAS